MKFAQFVMGPAGCGKSTYCAIIQEHFKVAMRRTCRVVNLDPAAENFLYDCYVDVRDLISVDDVMEELDYGPNGGLVFAMEYLSENMNWLEEQIADALDDDYYIFDCPGQIELYSHLPVMRDLVDMLQNEDFRVAGVYCIDVNFIEDASKFLSGALSALTAMVNLELPHINVLTKCDLLPPGGVDRQDGQMWRDTPMGTRRPFWRICESRPIQGFDCSTKHSASCWRTIPWSAL
mmetsp:Transcript_29638/g.64110  ORF Transcript_29638/g.64110 Transcript_29638/m.64110 type:complete len:234 (-) Transcript_29638:171-872(-)